jgi:hypothetical protein
MEYVMGHAVPGNKWRSSDGRKRAYYVFAFIMDRLTGTPKIELLTSRRAEGDDGRSTGSQAFGHNGWHFACLPVNFAVNGNPEIFFKVRYTPHAAVANTVENSQIIAVFTSDTLIKKTQRLLKAKGYNPGPIDGLMGRKTRQAIVAFQRENGMTADGKISGGVYGALYRAPERVTRQSQSRRPAQAAQYRPTDRHARFQSKAWPNQVPRQ